MTGFVFKLLWLVLRLVSWLLGIFLRLTVGLVWRQTLGRSDVYVRRDWDDRGLGRVRWPDLHDPRWDTMSGGAQVVNQGQDRPFMRPRRGSSQHQGLHAARRQHPPRLGAFTGFGGAGPKAGTALDSRNR